MSVSDPLLGLWASKVLSNFMENSIKEYFENKIAPTLKDLEQKRARIFKRTGKTKSILWNYYKK